ncbi:MAG: T9SS type A sorting domain-containing protein [Saprospiraceae bacterium]|nr:T9SS type A sorting domain-containing protein [Saprospiraceae bacterium]
MKNFLKIVFFLLALLMEGLSQVDYLWEKIQNDGNYSIYKGGIELMDQRLLFISYQSKTESRIEILSKEGFLLKQKNFSFSSLEHQLLRVFYLPSKERLLLLGSAAPNIFTLTEMDLNLNITFAKHDTLHDSQHLALLDGILEKERLLMVGNAWNGFHNESENSKIWFFNIDLLTYNIDAQLVNLKERSYFGHCYSIVKDIARDGYICLSGFLHRLDQNFRHLGYSKKDNYITMDNQVKIIKWKENSYLVGSSIGAGFSDTYLRDYNVLFQEFDTAFVRIRANGLKQASVFGFPNSVFDYVERNRLFIGGGDDVFFRKNRGFYVLQFDSLLNKQWEVYFTQDPRYRYTPTGILATSDGGVIVYGARFDILSDKIFRNHLIKFDGNGTVSWTDDQDKMSTIAIKFFSNPSTSGYLHVEITGSDTDVEMRIFNTVGKNVYVESDLANGSHQFDLQYLTSGTYVIKIYKDGKEFFSKLWVRL